MSRCILRSLGLGLTVWCGSGWAPEAAAAAQTTAPARTASATLSGTVTDSTGALIPHAAVEVSGPGGDEELQTDGAGRFSVSVAPGIYRLRVESEGFEPFLSQDVLLKANAVLRLPVQLAVAGVKEQIDVGTARGGSTDPNDNAGALVFSGSRLNMLSDDPATLQQQINAIAGPGLGGSTQILVNGFSGGRLPPKAAIRSISINRNPYSAYYDTPGFGRVEVDTKPGGDAFHGALDFAGTDQPFDTRNPYTMLQPPFYQFQTDGNLTGPIDKKTKKTTFFLAENIQQLANNAVVNAEVLDATLTPTTTSQALAAPQLTQTYSLRVDRQFNPNNFGFLRNEWSQTHVTNSGINPLVLPSSAFASNTLTDTLQAADTQVFGPHAVNEARFQYLRSRVSQAPNSAQPTLIVQGALQEFGNPAQALRDNGDHFELQDRFELDRGKHSVRAGFRLRELRDANYSNANFNGEYIFNNIMAYQLTERNLANCANPGSPLCLTPQQLQAAGGGASQFSITTGQPNALLYTDDIGIFAEDDWHVKRTVTFSYGLRLESQSAVPDHSDPAPRLGLAWAVRHGKSPMPLVVLRAGYGIFYQRFPAASLLQAIRQNGASELAYFAQNPTFFGQNPDGSPTLPPTGQLTANEPTIYRVNPSLRTSYTQAASISADRSIGRRGTASVTALYGHGTHEYLTRNINAPLPGTYNPAVSNSGTRPLGTAQNIYQLSSDTNENDELLFANTQLQLTKNLFIYGFYVLQRQIEEPQGFASYPSNQYDLKADYARATGVDTQSLNSAVIWTLPQGFGSALFFNAHSGAPFDITTGADLNGDTFYNDRPAFATDLTRPSVVRTSFGSFDTLPMPGQQIIPRNYGNSPGLFWVDLQLNKDFHIGPRPTAKTAGASAPGKLAPSPAIPDRPWELKFQVEIQNLLNHNNPGLPIGVLPTPGEPMCSGFTASAACSYFGHSLSLASDFSPLTASNRTILVQSFFTF